MYLIQISTSPAKKYFFAGVGYRNLLTVSPQLEGAVFFPTEKEAEDTLSTWWVDSNTKVEIVPSSEVS